MLIKLNINLKIDIFETIIPIKQIKINNAVHLLTNTILNDKKKRIKNN